MGAKNPRAFLAMAHPDRRARVTSGLREDGWIVRVADDGYDLVRLLSEALLTDAEAERPDLIVADATLGGLSGMTIVEGLRDLGWPTPIILIVDFNKPEKAELGKTLGANVVMEKPVDPEEVRKAARRLRPDMPGAQRAGRGKDPNRR